MDRLRFSILTTTTRTTEIDSGARFRTERAKSDGENEGAATELIATDDNDDEYAYEGEDDVNNDDDDVEQMQLDPGTDFYDEEDDDDDEAEGESDYNYGDLEIKPAKLTSDKVLDLNVDTTTKRNNERRHVTEQDEETDMGYDEDDERIAAKRPKTEETTVEKGYMNEEGSGGVFVSRFKDESRFRPNYMTFNKKGRNMYKERGGGIVQEVGAREGSGNFANDDEDDDNDDDDDDDGVGDDDNNNGGQAGGGSDSFFASKRKNSYFRKNTNDAIKIISTPLGKVGIVYQQTVGEDESGGGVGVKKSESADKTKQSTALTDFDALSPDPDSSRLASHPKITPVLTPDGKVALLYRGDSENTKYEPIRNLTTHKLGNKDDTTDNNDSYAATSTTTNKKHQKATFAKDSDEQTDFNESSDFELSDTKLLDKAHKTDYDKDPAAYTPIFVPPTSGSFIIRPTDSVLPMINRPLSEVLGIKKNQFKQFRVKDIATMSSSTDAIPRGASLAEQSSSSTTLHFLTKVNLAEYPTSLKGPNRDFDFSQDNTMLDERSRHREQFNSNQANGGANNDNTNSQQGQQQWSQIGDGDNAAFANEEMLSKTEVVDLAIIPHLDNELGRFNKHEVEARRHHRNRQTHRHRQREEDLSGIHCVMQIFMGIAAISTVFGMLGTFFKQRILDQLRLMHW